jgi:hypothetical protein
MNRVDQLKQAPPKRYPDAIKECWAIHEALRTLGFAAEDIYVVKGQSAQHGFNPPAFFVVLKAQEREFVVTVGLYESEQLLDEAIEQWTEFATRFNDSEFEEKDMQEIFESSNVGRNKTQFVVALLSKGLKCPSGMN